MLSIVPTPYQSIRLADHLVTVKRLDLLDAFGSGNKCFKLNHNLRMAKQRNKTTLITFGGAYSNHIAAVAAIGAAQHFKTIGLIRGDELAHKALNPTLLRAQAQGMRLIFLSRADYRRRNDADFLEELEQQFADSYILPEGGSNLLAVQGCQDILTAQDHDFDVLVCAVGTGATLAGIINASHEQQYVQGFAALKGNFLTEQIRQWTVKTNWHVEDDSEFGGYARYDARLLDFMAQMNHDFNLPLEPIYTAKALFRLKHSLERQPSCARILFIHTGGLQGFAVLGESSPLE